MRSEVNFSKTIPYDHGSTEIPYEETEHYQVTRDFLLNREGMLKILFEK